MTGLVQSTGEWWLQRRSMSRAHVVEYVTQMIWAAIAGCCNPTLWPGSTIGFRRAARRVDPAEYELTLQRRGAGR